MLNIAFLGITATSWSVSPHILCSSRIHLKILRQSIIPIIIIMYYEYISIFESFKFLNCGKKRKLGILRN